MQKLAEICIRRPVFASMLILAMVVVGAAAYAKLGVDRFPSVDLPTVRVSTSLPGASPTEVETEVSPGVESSPEAAAEPVLRMLLFLASLTSVHSPPVGSVIEVVEAIRELMHAISRSPACSVPAMPVVTSACAVVVTSTVLETPTKPHGVPGVTLI